AKIMYAGGNVMLLDEPTNHLDVYTREALEEALEHFTGALVVVSHDRYFIDRVVDNVMVVDGGAAEIYPGNYTDHVERVKAGLLPERRPPAGWPGDVSSPKRVAETATSQPARTPALRTEARKHAKRLKKIDEEIAALEARI